MVNQRCLALQFFLTFLSRLPRTREESATLSPASYVLGMRIAIRRPGSCLILSDRSLIRFPHLVPSPSCARIRKNPCRDLSLDGFARVAASQTKQDLRHVLDDKPPLRFGDDAEDSLSNRRVIKKPRFLVRGDTSWAKDASGRDDECQVRNRRYQPGVPRCAEVSPVHHCG